MPSVPSNYVAPFWVSNPHVHTIASALLRPTVKLAMQERTFYLQDRDRLFVRFSTDQKQQLVVLVHGLGGDSGAVYIQRLAALLIQHGFQVALINLRGAGPVSNDLPVAYHGGRSDDLTELIDQLAPDYQKIHLVGFSLGGNIVLKYASEFPETVSPKVASVVGVSVPCDLVGAAEVLHEPKNRLYARRFLKRLKQIVKPKLDAFEELADLKAQWPKIKTIYAFDDAYTAPIHGFGYYERLYKEISCRQFLHQLQVPAYLLTAQDDPFLSWSCYPFPEAEASTLLHFEAPTTGGHVGFLQTYDLKAPTYAEEQVVAFLQGHS